MKKSKRLASVLLAFLLVLSCCATGFSALALEDEEPSITAESSLDEAADADETVVESDVAKAVEEYKKLTEVKDSLTPEQEEALREAEKVIVEFGMNCTDKMTSPEAVAAYNNLFSSVADTAGEALAGFNLTDSIGTFKTMVADLAADVEETAAERFIRIVNSVEEPYDNADIAMVKTAYELLPNNASIPAEVMQKYHAILACIGPDIASTEQPDLSGFEKTVVTYPTGVTKSQVEQAIPKLDELIDTILPLLGVEGMDDGLNAYIQNDLYTNATIGALAKTLASLGTLEVGGMSLFYGSTQEYASAVALFFLVVDQEAYMNPDLDLENPPEDLGIEDTYVGAVRKFLAYSMEPDPEVAQTMWDEMTFESGDFNFEDGDKEGFKDALAALFRPFNIINIMGAQVLISDFLRLPTNFINQIDTENGTYTYGAYEDLVPLFETLGFEDVKSSHEYTLAYLAMVSEDTPETEGYYSMRGLEAAVRPLLDSIFLMVDDLGEAPVETLLDLLTRLAYTIKTGMLDTQVHAMLDHLGFGEIDWGEILGGLGLNWDLSLTSEGLYDLIAPLLEDITVKDAEIDEETGEEITPATTITIKLDKEKFVQFINDLGGCGDAVVADSVARGTAYRLAVEPDRADALLVLFRWLYGELTTEENIDAFKTAVEVSDMDSTVKTVLKVVLSAVSKIPADTAFVFVINLLAPNVPGVDGNLPSIPGLPSLPDLPSELPDLSGGDNSGLSGIVDTVSGLFGGLFGGDDNSGDANSNSGGSSQTENPSIPSGGGKVTMSAFAVAFAAAAVIGAVTLKKKEDND